MDSGSLSFEKRKYPRIKVTLPVEYKVVNESDDSYVAIEKRKAAHSGDSKNVSAEGLFLVCDKLLEKGDIVKLEMSLPDEEKPIRAFAEIIWVSDKGVPQGKYGAGLYFMALRDEDADRIGRLIASMIKTA